MGYDEEIMAARCATELTVAFIRNTPPMKPDTAEALFDKFYDFVLSKIIEEE